MHTCDLRGLSSNPAFFKYVIAQLILEHQLSKRLICYLLNQYATMTNHNTASIGVMQLVNRLLSSSFFMNEPPFLSYRAMTSQILLG
jgi:hypothetical protein